MYGKSRGKSDKRRSPGYNNATAVGTIDIQRLGITFITYKSRYRDSQHNGYQHRQREELAQHTVVCP